MSMVYEEKKEALYLTHKISKHIPPHLHSALEFVYITNGTLELGVGQELFHMKKGDFAIVFPNMIHHYQVLSEEVSKAFYLFPALSLCGQFQNEMQRYCPQNPVIKKEQVHADIPNAIHCLYKEKIRNPLLDQAYVQIILARSMPCFNLLVEKDSFGSRDMVYQAVAYIAEHFKEELSLDVMAKDLGVSKYVLSRVFSATFHKNFNQYLNEQRMNYVISLLENSTLPITDICLDAGFQSQRTFNRVFLENYKMTPSEYRNNYKDKYIMKDC